MRRDAHLPVANDIAAGTESRVLVAAPTRRDAELTCGLLARAGIACEAIADLAAFAAGVEAGAGALVLTDAALADPAIDRVLAALALQPGWSDMPVIVLAPDRGQPMAMSRVLDSFTNLTLLDRPASTRSLLSAVKAALRARARQYQIRDQLDELRLADRALRDADQRKDQFLATLAHELRNPLAPIRSGLAVLERIPGDDPQAVGVREMMQRQLVALVRLIDDLLDVSRIATGKVRLQRETVDLRRVVESALEVAQPQLRAKRQTLGVRLPTEPVGVLGDPMRLAQVIGNLVNNASKYTPDNGHIEVGLDVEGRDAVLRVRDDGVGIPAHMLDHVFDLFTQVDGTRDQSQGGLGIGLSLARRLMELHGGSAVAESDGPNRGSTFTLRLPTLSMPADAPTPTSAEPPRALARPRVLIVDDNVHAADSLALALTLDGYATHAEYSGEAALRAVERFRPGAILCDIGLPGMDGHAVAQRVRSDPGHAGIMLVAISGLGSAADKRRARAAGFDFHLVKPVPIGAVVRLLDECEAARTH
jgi:signal transduction histidine kinase/ActR/RegA family two-component response regulator